MIKNITWMLVSFECQTTLEILQLKRETDFDVKYNSISESPELFEAVSSFKKGMLF